MTLTIVSRNTKGCFKNSSFQTLLVVRARKVQVDQPDFAIPFVFEIWEFKYEDVWLVSGAIAQGLSSSPRGCFSKVLVHCFRLKQEVCEFSTLLHFNCYFPLSLFSFLTIIICLSRKALFWKNNSHLGKSDVGCLSFWVANFRHLGVKSAEH